MFTERLLGFRDCIQCCGRVMSPDGHSDARREPWGARALERQRHLLTLTQPESRHSRTGAQPVPPISLRGFLARGGSPHPARHPQARAEPELIC